MSTQSPTPVLAVIDRANPWLGLASFTEETRAFFHGRDEEIRALTRLMERKALTILFGQSGLGKSSLLQAGVFPRLRAASFLPIYIRLDHSDGAPSPTEQVKAMVAAGAQRAGTWTKPGSAKPGETLWEFFHHRDDRLVASGTGVSPASLPKPGVIDPTGKMPVPPRTIVPVLVFDQFEELFTLGAAAGAQRDRAVAFMSELAELVENRPSERLVARLEQSADEMDAFDFSRTDYRVCISLREDYLPHLESLKTIMPALMENRMRLTRMTGTQALDAVLKPGAGIVTDEVARAIVEFVSGARGGSTERLAELDVEPPLLSVICRELNERRRALGQAQITADLVTGNRREILHDFYERSVADLPEGMRRFVEDKLLTKSGFRDNLALETALEEPGVIRPLIDTLVSRRLLRIEDRIGTQRLELTHDVLADVVRASRDARQQRLALEQAREREQRVLAAAAKRTRRLRWLVAGLATAIAALAVAGAFGLRARHVALQQSSRTDAAFASQLLDQGRVSGGLAYLVRAAAKDPLNRAIGPRLASLLASHNFALPEGAPLKLSSSVVDVHFSADGKRFLVTCEDGTLAFVDASTGESTQAKLPPFMQRLRGVGGWVGPRLVVGGEDGVVRVVNLETSRIEREFRFDQKIVSFLVRDTPVANVWMRLADSTLVLAEADTGATKALPFKAVNLSRPNLDFQLTVTGDGRWAARFEFLRNEAQIWDLAAGAQTATISVPGRLWTARFVREGAAPLLVTSYFKEFVGASFRLWSVPDGRPVSAAGTMPATQANQGVAVRRSQDGRLFLIIGGFGMQAFEASTGEPGGPVFSSTVSGAGANWALTPDGRIVAVLTATGGVQLCELASGKALFAPLDVGGTVRHVEFDATGEVMLTTANGGAVRLWDVQTGQLLAEPSVQQTTNVVAALSPTAPLLVTGSVDGVVDRSRIGGGAAQALQELFANSGNLALTFLPGSPGRLLQLNADRAHIIDLASGREINSFAYPESFELFQYARSFTPDCKVMVVLVKHGAETKCQAWTLDPASGVTGVVELQGAPTVPGRAVFSPRGDLVALAGAGPVNTVRLWNLKTGAPVAKPLVLDGTLSPVGGIVTRESFSHDGSRFAAGDTAGLATVWDTATGDVVLKLSPAKQRAINLVRFNPDGTRLVTVYGSGESQLWDLSTGTRAGPVLYQGEGAIAAEFSSDGRYLVIGSFDGTAQVWDGHTGATVGEPLRHKNRVRAVQFSPDSQRVMTAAEDGTVRIWDARTGEPLSEPFVHDSRVSNAQFSPDGNYVFAESVSSRLGGGGAGWFWPVPPESGGAPVPQWLLDLATICAGKRLNDDGRFVNAADASAKIAEVRRTLAALPADAPFAEWGRWFLADRATRSIAPGFTITPAEADKLREDCLKAGASAGVR